MKIVMLGHSGAGKTTYVSLMYDEMYEGMAGFSIRAARSGHHDELMRAARSIRRGSYPAATHQRTSFEFVLRHDGDDVLPFEWRDYRGGALNDRRDGGADVTELHEDLVTADGIVLFVDGVKLVADARARRDVRRLTTLVHRALDERGEVLTPFVIAVTKSDLVDDDAPGVVEKIFEPFEEIINAVGATQHIAGTILPVACGPEPMNVSVPVLWALRFGVLGAAMRLQEAVESAERTAEYAESRDTLWDRISSPFKDEESYASIARRHRVAAMQGLQQLAPLVEPAEQLALLLEDVKFF